MKKVVLLPLDERPCNYRFAQKLFGESNIELKLPPKEILGDKKQSADIDKVSEFVKKECENADYLVVSAEMLLYGGLLPSRLHFDSVEAVQQRVELLREIKKNNAKIKIFLFSLIMRCPKYSNADEEPDYYDICGSEIHQIGIVTHKVKLGLISEKDGEEQIANFKRIAKEEYLNDYVARRKFNLGFVIENLGLLSDETVDFMLIPQDDSAKFGYTAMDQEVVRKYIKENNLQSKCLLYPGADEIALTLLARVINDIKKYSPKIHLIYASDVAKTIIPLYEDRPLNETLKYHIIASGAELVAAESDADIIMLVNSPPSDMKESNNQDENNPQYSVERNLIELVYKAKKLIERGKIVGICDNAFANGGEKELISLLIQEKILFKLASYAGWNTSSNTAGTAISSAINYYYFKNTQSHYNFLADRIVEDVLYCAIVRKMVANLEVNQLGYNYFFVKDKNGEIASAVLSHLNEEKSKLLKNYSKNIKITKVEMPWRRMFEVDVDTEYQDD